MSQKLMRQLNLLLNLLMLPVWGFLFWRGFVEGDISLSDVRRFGLSIFFVLVAGILFLNVILILKPRENDKPHSGVPIWLSQKRLAFINDDCPNGETVQIADVESAHLNYIEGSIALSFHTATQEFNFPSSDAENLLRHIFSIRPDLEPSS